jgi:transcriptional regulator GlxA family with amidase domain
MARRIVLVCFDQAQPLDIVGPFEVFAGANAARLHAGAEDPPYALSLLSPGGAAVRGESGLGLLVDGSLERIAVGASPRLDTLLVCGGRGARMAATDPSVQKAVRRAAKGARRVASVCTGAFVLAASGLLDDKRATTHWASCARLARQYPRVQVETAPIYVRDGRVWTSAGVTAGIDLALALVEEDLGRELASQVARHLVVFVRRAGGQAQFSAQLSLQTAERAPLRELMAWIVDHPAAVLDVPALAERANLSIRHFTRLFREQTGSSPAAYVEHVRVETARRLLETSERSIEQVADAAGFGTPESLRRAFGRRVELSPSEYRARFGAR